MKSETTQGNRPGKRKDAGERTTSPLDWITLLNDQAEWTSLDDLKVWFTTLAGREVTPSTEALTQFWDALTYVRSITYDLHFGRVADFQPLNEKLANARFGYHGDLDNSRSSHIPRFRAYAADDSDSALLTSLAQTLLMSFAQDMANHGGGEDVHISRCEGLYREPHLTRLSAAPGIDDDIEMRWREELEVLVEKGLQQSREILRCADLFVATSRSRFCSNSCRVNTFQLVKQLMDPAYLAEKQRRYRAKRT